MMMAMQLLVLTAATARKHEHHKHHHKRQNLVMVGGCKVEGPGAVQTLAGGGSDGTVDGTAPHMNIYKDGFWDAGCLSDEMVKTGDKYGDGKFSYKTQSSANTSVVFYGEIVEPDSQKPMTPKVCFDFCRTVPDMTFFGLIYGRECYCSHYWKKTTGEGVCDLPCEGDAGSICGGAELSSMYQMHKCVGGLAQDVEDLDEKLFEVTYNGLSDDEAILFEQGEAMQFAGEKLESYAEGSASGLAQAAKVAAGPVLHASEDLVELIDEIDSLTLGPDPSTDLSFDERKEVEEYMAKAKEIMDAAEQAMAAGDELQKATAFNEKLSDYEPAFVQAMRQIDSEYEGKMVVCEGDSTGMPKVGLSWVECAAACDNAAPKSSEDYCIYFQHFMLPGESPLCFLYTDITAVTTYNCDLPEEVSGSPDPDVPSLVQKDDSFLSRKHHKKHKTAKGLHKNTPKKEHLTAKEAVQRFLLAKKMHFNANKADRSDGPVAMCMVRLADVLGVTPDLDAAGKKGMTHIDRCFGAE
jgi:hypothetical protein